MRKALRGRHRATPLQSRSIVDRYFFGPNPPSEPGARTVDGPLGVGGRALGIAELGLAAGFDCGSGPRGAGAAGRAGELGDGVLEDGDGACGALLGVECPPFELMP